MMLNASSGLFDTSGAFLLGSCSLKEARISTGFECRESTLCSLEKMPQIKRPVGDVQSNNLTARLETVPNQAQLSRSPVWGGSNIVS